MKASILSMVLQDLRARASNPITWIIILGIAVAAGLTAPFDTEGLLRPFPMTVYWLMVVTLTYWGGACVDFTLARMGMSLPATIVVGCVLTTGVVISVVSSLNVAFFGRVSGTAILPFMAKLGLVTCVITTTLILVEYRLGYASIRGGAKEPRHNGRDGRLSQADTRGPGPGLVRSDAVQTPGQVPLLRRVPPEKRGDLVALSVEDHYTRVRTTQGESLILMRLSDAIDATEPVRGLQVHRSYWVALNAVKDVSRERGRMVLKLTHGDDVPVSRTYAPALRHALVLER